MTGILGLGRVGSAIARCVPDAQFLDRQSTAAQFQAADPLWVCVPNAALSSYLPHCAHGIFVQNGGIELPQSATRAIIYFAAMDRHAPVKVGEESLLFGPCAEVALAQLQAGGIAARVVQDAAEFQREVAIKTGWCCIIGLLGEMYGLPAGLSAQRPELDALARELAPAIGVSAEILAGRWRGYSASIPDYPARLRDLPWRTTWLLGLAAAQGYRLPLHRQFLANLKRPDRDPSWFDTQQQDMAAS
jgi:hypothetical protein